MFVVRSLYSGFVLGSHRSLMSHGKLAHHPKPVLYKNWEGNLKSNFVRQATRFDWISMAIYLIASEFNLRRFDPVTSPRVQFEFEFASLLCCVRQTKFFPV